MTAAAKLDNTNAEPARVSSLANGFDMLARDLRRAWRLAGLNDAEQVLLDVIQEGCWVIPLLRTKKGDPRPEASASELNVSDLARRSGIARTSLQRGLANLIASRLVFQLGEDGSRLYLINKDFTTWLTPARPATAKRPERPARPRFDANQLLFIRNANRPGSPQKAWWEVAQPVASVPLSSVLPTAESATPPDAVSSHPLTQKRDTPCSAGEASPVALQPHLKLAPPTPPIGERPRDLREIDSKTKVSGEKGEVGVPAHPAIPDQVSIPEASSSQPTHAGVLSLREESNSTTTPSLGGLPIVGTRAKEAQALQRWVSEQTFPGVGDVAKGFCDALPIAWIEAAVRCRMVGHQNMGERYLKNLLAKILEGCRQSGTCEWYGIGTKSAAPVATEGSSPVIDMHPAAVRRREIRASFGNSGKADQWAGRRALPTTTRPGNSRMIAKVVWPRKRPTNW